LLTRLEVRRVDDIEAAFAFAIRERVDAMMPVSSALFDAAKHRIVSLAAKHRLPDDIRTPSVSRRRHPYVVRPNLG
jgi:hypothetical protein